MMPVTPRFSLAIVAAVLVARGEAAAGTGVPGVRVAERGTDGREQLVPARVHLTSPDGKPVRAPGLPFFRDHLDCPGALLLDLPPGAYRYVVERGPESSRAAGEIL